MKRTAISLMLALAMVFSLVLAVAPQAQAAEHQNHCVCGGKWAGNTQYHACADITDWAPLGMADLLLNTALTSGNYYLTEDIVLVAPLSVVADSTVTICLNGYNLSGNVDSQAEDARVFNQILGGGTLNITDCAAEEGVLSSTLTKTTGGVGYNNQADFTFNMYAGTVEAIRVAAAGGAFRFSAGVFNMYGGTIQNGDSKTFGGNIAMYGTFNMYGGTIKNGSADQKCGNLYLGGGGVANLYGGYIYGGSCPQNSDIWVYYKEDGSSFGHLNVYNLDSSFKLYYENEDHLDVSNMDASLKLENKAPLTQLVVVKEGYVEPTEPPEPTVEPTEEPTEAPTQAPTQEPTQGPTQKPADDKPAEAEPVSPIVWVVIAVAVVAVVVIVVVVVKKKKD